VGAAVAAAVTNVGMNVLNLLQARSALGLSPYNRSYVHLLAPAAAMVGATLLLRKNSAIFSHDWIAVGAAAIMAYTVFGGMVLMFGLDADDRLIANAVWLRIRGAVGLGPSEAAP
jgi:hypothetical protein